MKNYFKLLKDYRVTWKILALLLMNCILVILESWQVKSFQMVLKELNNPSIWVFYAVINIGTPLFSRLLYFCVTKVLNRFATNYRQTLYDKVLSMPMSRLQELKIGDVTTAIHYAGDITSSVIDIPFWIIECFVAAASSLVFMYAENWLLSTILLIELIPFGLFIVFMRNKVKILAKERRALDSKVDTKIDRLKKFLSIKSFAKEQRESKNFRELGAEFERVTVNKKNTAHNMWTFVRLLSSLLEGTIVIYAVFTYNKGTFDMSEILLFSMFHGTLMSPFMNINNMVDQVVEFNTHLSKNEELLREPDEYDGIVRLEEFNDSIVFNNVGFHYDDSDEILQNVCLEIPKGKKIGIFGPSGGGKSTMINLLMRFFKVTSGEILIDNVNINEFTKSSLRKRIGIVNQEVDSLLFSDMNIKENISYGLSGSTDVQIVEAARKAHADEFISELPNGYESMIGNDGVKLSGGQKQRIVLARLFLLNPDILILDEATSKLDNVSEDLIKESIELLSKDKTVISIAHRFTTIEDADLLIGIKNHTIYERGTKEELNVEGTLFHELYR